MEFEVRCGQIPGNQTLSNLSGELVQGETHSYFEILDANKDDKVSLEEMRVGVATGQKQCIVLRMINAETFQEKDCFDGEVIVFYLLWLVWHYTYLP